MANSGPSLSEQLDAHERRREDLDLALQIERETAEHCAEIALAVGAAAENGCVADLRGVGRTIADAIIKTFRLPEHPASDDGTDG